MANYIISSGHGKHVAGANGYINEVTEARKVVNRVASLLNNSGHDTIKHHDNTTRNQRDNVNGIVDYHNSKSRKVDVSVHFNAFKTTNDPMGVEVLYISNNGKKIAEKVSSAIAKVSGLKNRGAKKRTNLGFLNGTEKPAILIEVCFVDSKADVNIYKDKFDEICKAIAESLSGGKVSERQDKPSKPKPSNKGVQWVGTKLKGRRIESIYRGSEGLNFYDSPRWNRPSGTFGYGAGWIVDNLYRVDGSLMYRVQNSNKDLYYITASSKYVRVK